MNKIQRMILIAGALVLLAVMVWEFRDWDRISYAQSRQLMIKKAEVEGVVVVVATVFVWFAAGKVGGKKEGE